MSDSSGSRRRPRAGLRVSIDSRRDGDGGWAERIERAREARGITPETVTFWEEASNGIVWGIAELPPDEFASDVSLDAALDRLVDEVLMNPDPDPSFLDWLESRIG